MAQRRMFSKTITNSGRFIKMPQSSQALYFHLGIHSDDDGIVEAYQVMRMIGASEDDLKILVAKGLVCVLNEDLVTYIIDWHEHNLIRADRKIDSMYKNLLLQMLPEIKLIEARERADKKHGQPPDVHGTANGPHRIGKDRIGKDNEDKRKTELPESFIALYNSYPRKIGKIAAYKSYVARKKDGVTDIDMTQAVENYSALIKRNRTEEKFIMHMSTFFGPGLRYQDYLTTVKKEESNVRYCGDCGAELSPGGFCFTCHRTCKNVVNKKLDK